MSEDFFASSGIWLKGNLHSHSTNSDGRLEPEKVMDYYYHYGYDFIALTDHEKITKAASRNLLLIPGTEVATGKGALGDHFHIVALNVEDNDAVQRYKIESVDSLLEYVVGVKGLTFIAHPYWSNLASSDLSEIENYVGIEVYNTGCDVEVAKGFSAIHWDNLLAQKKRVYGFAVDDGHSYSIDSAGGWIWVKVKKKSTEGILDSIREGRFYSTMGPSIEYLSYSDGKLEARFSPVKRADVVSNDGTGFSASLDSYKKIREMKNGLVRVEFSRNKEGGEDVLVETGSRRACLRLKDDSLTSISLEGVPFQKYLRLEITDSDGKKAWSNATFL